MKIMLYEQTSVRTVFHVMEVYDWCTDNFGPPNGRWKYGKECEPDSPFAFINSPYEIDSITVNEDADAIMFLLRWQ